MTLAQIIEALALQVYVRRGELVIHFSSPSDLVNRVAECVWRLPNWRHRGRTSGRIGLGDEPRSVLLGSAEHARRATLAVPTRTSSPPAETSAGVFYGGPKVLEVHAP